MRDLIAARDRECPYCQRPARHCDVDHLTDWHTSRETSARNAGAKCEYHHYLKDEPGWRLDYDPGTQTATIITPTGRTYIKKKRPIIEPKSRSDIPIPHQRQPAKASTPDANAPPADDPPF